MATTNKKTLHALKTRTSSPYAYRPRRLFVRPSVENSPLSLFFDEPSDLTTVRNLMSSKPAETIKVLHRAIPAPLVFKVGADEPTPVGLSLSHVPMDFSSKVHYDRSKYDLEEAQPFPSYRARLPHHPVAAVSYFPSLRFRPSQPFPLFTSCTPVIFEAPYSVPDPPFRCFHPSYVSPHPVARPPRSVPERLVGPTLERFSYCRLPEQPSAAALLYVRFKAAMPPPCARSLEPAPDWAPTVRVDRAHSALLALGFEAARPEEVPLGPHVHVRRVREARVPVPSISLTNPFSVLEDETAHLPLSPSVPRGYHFALPLVPPSSPRVASVPDDAFWDTIFNPHFGREPSPPRVRDPQLLKRLRSTITLLRLRRQGRENPFVAADMAAEEVVYEEQAGWFSGIKHNVSMSVSPATMEKLNSGLGGLLDSIKSIADNFQTTANGLAKTSNGVSESINKMLIVLPVVAIVYFFCVYPTSRWPITFALAAGILAAFLPGPLCELIKPYFTKPVANPLPAAQAGLSDDLPMLLATTGAWFCSRGKDTVSYVDSVMLHIGNLPKVQAGANSLMGWLLPFSERLLNALLRVFGVDQVNWTTCHAKVVDDYCAKVGAVVANFAKCDLTNFHASDMVNLTSLVSEGLALQNIYRMDREVCGVLASYVGQLHSLCNVFAPAMTSSKGNRPEPVVICLYGPPGIGKSMLTTDIATRIACRYLPLDKWPPNEDFSTQIFQKPSSEYWNGYASQLVTVMDDWLQPTDVAGNRDNGFMDLVSLANCWSLPLNFADLPSKGRFFFESKVIMLTTNVRDVPTKARTCVADPSAVIRRIKFPYRLLVKEEYRRPGMAAEDPCCLDVEKLKAEMPTADSEVPIHIWELAPWDCVSHDYVGPPISIEEAVALAVAAMKSADNVHGVIKNGTAATARKIRQELYGDKLPSLQSTQSSDASGSPGTHSVLGALATNFINPLVSRSSSVLSMPSTLFPPGYTPSLGSSSPPSIVRPETGSSLRSAFLPSFAAQGTDPWDFTRRPRSTVYRDQAGSEITNLTPAQLAVWHRLAYVFALQHRSDLTWAEFDAAKSKFPQLDAESFRQIAGDDFAQLAVALDQHSESFVMGFAHFCFNKELLCTLETLDQYSIARSVPGTRYFVPGPSFMFTSHCSTKDSLSTLLCQQVTQLT
jgi:hypothetical protein